MTLAKSAELREAAFAKLQEAKALVDDEGNLPAEKQGQFQSLMTEFRDLDKQVEEAAKTEAEVTEDLTRMRDRMSWYTEKATGKPLTFSEVQLDPTNKVMSMGEQFVQSATYKNLVASGAFEGTDTHFRSDRVVVGAPIKMGAAATDIIQTESGGPANLPNTQLRWANGVMLPLPQRPLVFRDLFPNENMPTGDTIDYAAQTGFDNAAAAVAQATSVSTGAKAQSSIAWTERSSKAQWIATWMAATRQALADINQLRSLIDNQGRLMIRIEEDRELISGSGTAPELRGILNTSGVQTLGLAGTDNLDGVRDARRLVKTGLSRLDPTFIAVNPVDSEEFDLLKDANGMYRGGNPIGNFNFDQSIWRLTRVETEALTAGTALVGAGAGATVYERQPLSVLVADQHSDFFIRNLVVILFEERLAFPVYFPTAFVVCTLNIWT